MIGKIIDINTTEAFVELADGRTINVPVNSLEIKANGFHSRGEYVTVDFCTPTNMFNDKMVDFF